MSRNGYFITFEGIEGAGKTTQAEMLYRQLEQEGLPVKFTREPGGTAIGEKIRGILADPDTDIDPMTEVLLLSASRSQLVQQFIRPQLEEGNIVICDRFSDSTVAYQGFGRKVHLTHIHEVTDMCTWGVRPSLTILVDIDPKKGLGRVRTRSAENLTKMDRLENMDMEFHEKVREGYLEIANEEPSRFRIFDGNLPVDELAARISACVAKEVSQFKANRRRLTYERDSLGLGGP
jgi:dTMP kinase